MSASAPMADTGEAESDAADREFDSSSKTLITATSAAKGPIEHEQPQHNTFTEGQYEQREADDGMELHLDSAGSPERDSEDAATFGNPAQPPSAVEQHATLNPASAHITDDTLESSTQPSEGVTVEPHSTVEDSHQQDDHLTTQLSAAANESSQTMSQPVSEEPSQYDSVAGEDHHMSYNGGSAVRDRTVPHDAAADQRSEGPVKVSEVAGEAQTKHPEALDSFAVPEEHDKFQQDGGTTEGEQGDERSTSNHAIASRAIPEGSGVAPDEEAENNGDDDDDDDWDDDFGTFEEAAEAAAAQPSAQAAEHIPMPPVPEVPDPSSVNVEASQLSALLGSSHEEFLQAVSRHLLGPELPGSGEPCNVGSSSVDDSLQHLANQLRSSYSRASELTQQALQIGTKQGAQCVEPIPWAGSDTEAAFLASLPFRQQASDQGAPPPAGEHSDSAVDAVSRGPSHTSQEGTEATSTSRKHADAQARGPGSTAAQIRVGMDSSAEPAGGGDNAALRALVQKLPDLNYMLSDTLVPPSRTR